MLSQKGIIRESDCLGQCLGEWIPWLTPEFNEKQTLIVLFLVYDCCLKQE